MKQFAEQLENNGIELMQIDATNYVIAQLPDLDITTFPNSSFCFEFQNEDGISFEGSGFVVGKNITGFRMDFSSDFFYKGWNSDECVFYQVPTNISVNLELIEKELIDWLNF